MTENGWMSERKDMVLGRSVAIERVGGMLTGKGNDVGDANR